MNFATSILLLALTACAGSAPAEVHREIHRVDFTIDLSNPRPSVLEIRLFNGHVLVTPGAQLACELRCDVPAKSRAEAEELARNLEISSPGDTPGVHRIAVLPPAGLPLATVHCEVKLCVPDDVEVRVSSVGGDVTVRGFAGRLSIDTDYGRIRASLGGGHAELASRSGHTMLAGDYESAHVVSDRGDVVVVVPPRDRFSVLLENGSGTIEVQARRGTEFDVVFDTRSGTVLSELPVRWQRQPATDDGRVRYVGRLGSSDLASAHDIRVTSESGNLELVALPTSGTSPTAATSASTPAPASHD